METQTAPKQRGNPNFGKKPSAEAQLTEDLNRQYIFQLTKTHEKSKPISAKLGDMGGAIFSPYQPYYGVVNSGLAWDGTFVPKNGNKEKPGGSRRWRYLHGFPTIWVDEQMDPEPTKEDLASNLNDLTFRNGVLRVFGYETTKLQALMVNDAFGGCKRPLKDIPKQYVLLNQDEIDKSVLASLDDAFDAETIARGATLQEMYACAYYFGINLQQSDIAIRKDFISRARSNPKVFNEQFTYPVNQYKWVFKSALDNNIISTTIVPGCVYLVDSNTKVYDLNTGDAITELSQAVFANEPKSSELYQTLKKMMEV